MATGIYHFGATPNIPDSTNLLAVLFHALITACANARFDAIVFVTSARGASIVHSIEKTLMNESNIKLEGNF